MNTAGRFRWACVLAGLLLCGCGGQAAEPVQPEWDAALRQAVCAAETEVAGYVPECGWEALHSVLPQMLLRASETENGAYLRALTWERQQAAKGRSLLTLRLLYDTEPEQLLREQAALSAYTAKWAAQNRMLPPEVRVLLAHDAVIRGCPFPDASEDGTAYSALLCGNARCAGYAAAFRALCTAAGIPCRTVRGTVCRAGENALHAWNLVQLGGQWYHIDCTWDAGAFVPRHTWFLRCDAEMSETHAWDRRSIPAAEGGTLSYRAIVQTMRDM